MWLAATVYCRYTKYQSHRAIASPAVQLAVYHQAISQLRFDLPARTSQQSVRYRAAKLFSQEIF